LEKLVSRIAILRSEEKRLENLADSAGLDENDPRSVARWINKMGREMGEDMGRDLDQSLEEAAQGGDDSAPGVEDEGPSGPSETD
jgi:hypothetical protein